jgi:hypothetical protein
MARFIIGRMNLHSYPTFQGDSVYDTLRGYGTIKGVNNTVFNVEFRDGTQIAYDESGKAMRGSAVTLYWHDPISLIPPKSSNEWVKRKAMAKTIEQYFSKD